jgi:hypothetical protein
VQPSSYGVHNSSREHQYNQYAFDAAENDNFAPRPHGKYPLSSTKSAREHGKPASANLSQSLVLNIATLETYHNNSGKRGSSICSEESLNGVTNDYSQQGYFIHLPPPPVSQLESESIQVSETPIEEQVHRTPRHERGRDADGAHHKSQFLGEYLQQQATDEEQDAILVHETPPEFLWTRARCSD